MPFNLYEFTDQVVTERNRYIDTIIRSFLGDNVCQQLQKNPQLLYEYNTPEFRAALLKAEETFWAEFARKNRP